MSTINSQVVAGVTLGLAGYTSPLTITSVGTVSGGSGVAIYAPSTYANPTIVNQGMVADTGGFPAIELLDGGTITNIGNGALISGSTGIDIAGAVGTITNTGTILGTGGTGIVLAAGGAIIDAGRIGGGTGTAIAFGGSGTNGLVLDPGYALGGVVVGSTSSGAFNVLELASATSAGTVSAALQTEFVNFGTATVDVGANWTLTGNSTIGPGVTTSNGVTGLAAGLRDSGTLTNTGTLSGGGVVLGGTFINAATGQISATQYGIIQLVPGPPGLVTNAGTIVATGSGVGIELLFGGTVSNTAGLIKGGTGVLIASTGTLINAGTIATGATLAVNMSSGLLSNSGTIIGYVKFGTGSSTVNNSGSIGGDIRFGRQNVGTLINSGRISAYSIYGNNLTNASGAYIGTSEFGISVGNSISNAGVLQFSGAGISAAQLFNTGLISGVVLNDFVGIGVGGFVSNSGSIIDSGGESTAIYGYGATIANTGLVQGSHQGVYIGGSTGKVTNSGRISGAQAGVALKGSGTVINSGTITGTLYGVRLAGGGTLIDAGTISAGAFLPAHAIGFGGSGANLLILEHGYAITGYIAGSATAGATNTLELLGTAGAVSVGFNTLSLSNFGTVAFGAPSGNSETLTITSTAALPGMIGGFSQLHDIIDLTQINPVGATATLGTGNHLIVSNGSQSVSLQLGAGNYGGVMWRTSVDSGIGTDVGVACYCRGTMILTPNGEVSVEELAIGDLLVTMSGEARPIRWIGRRGYDGRFVAGNCDVLPICIKPDAIMTGVPARELWISPEHSLYVDDVLVQAKHLINGVTVVQAASVDEVEYFHIELDSHDVIYADGMPAETFVDCDNRLMFANGAEYARLYPEDERPHWQFCAPRLEWGSQELLAIREWMFDRTPGIGRIDEHDSGLHLVVDATTVLPIAFTENVARFELPSGSREVWLCSRTMVPAERDATSFDGRRLGVAMQRIVLSDTEISIDAWHGHSAFIDGFHSAEISHRWTDGRARIPGSLLRPFAGPIALAVHLSTNRAIQSNAKSASGQIEPVAFVGYLVCCRSTSGPQSQPPRRVAFSSTAGTLQFASGSTCDS